MIYGVSEWAYRTHFACYMQDSIHWLNECANERMHWVILDKDGMFQGLTCLGHHTHALSLMSPDDSFTFVPFELIKEPNYTK